MFSAKFKAGLEVIWGQIFTNVISIRKMKKLDLGQQIINSKNIINDSWISVENIAKEQFSLWEYVNCQKSLNSQCL